MRLPDDVQKAFAKYGRLTRRQLADAMGVHLNTITRACKSGALPRRHARGFGLVNPKLEFTRTDVQTLFRTIARRQQKALKRQRRSNGSK